MTVQDIGRVQEEFVAAAKRALAAGFEWLELHFAHGYLAHEFYSPLANKRTDSSGGSFENRIRFLLETLISVRKVWPERFPLTARLSVTDWIDGRVMVEESIELVHRLKAAGLDLLDVSQGFITPDISHIPWGPGFMIPITSRIRRETGIATAVGWMISPIIFVPSRLDSIGGLFLLGGGMLLAQIPVTSYQWSHFVQIEEQDDRQSPQVRQ